MKKKKKKKRKGFFSFLMSSATALFPSLPPSLTAAATHTHKHAGSQTLFESMHPLKQKATRRSEGRRRHAWECRRAQTHEHIHSPSNPLILRSHTSQSLRLSVFHCIFLHQSLSLDSRCVVWVSSLQHFYSHFETIFTHSSIGAWRYTYKRLQWEQSVLLLSLCATCHCADETDQQL